MNPLSDTYLHGKRPTVALAPMAGVTDLPFRTLCESLGADYSVTEMAASAPQLLDSDKNQSRLHFTPRARIKILQIIGNNAQHMADAAARYADVGADIIDINLGCPAKKVSSKGAGSALLSDLDHVQKILQAVVKRCPVPVTVKTRLGTDHDNYTLLNVGEIATDLGIDLMTVHGRTRACKFTGYAQFEEIAKLKQRFPYLSVIANGDIDSVESAQRILQQTHCDGIMIGRGAVGNPWLFSDIQAHFDPTLHSVSQSTSQPNQSLRSKMDLVINHIKQTHALYGDKKGTRFARKHIQAYCKHFGISKAFQSLAKVDDAHQQLIQLTRILQTHVDEQAKR